MSVVNAPLGWLNWARAELGIADDRVEALAKIRGEICLACPSVGKTKIICGECGCGVQQKIRVKSESCPLKKW